MTDTLALDDALRYVAEHRDETLADLVELAPKMIDAGFSLLGDNFHSPDEHFALGQARRRRCASNSRTGWPSVAEARSGGPNAPRPAGAGSPAAGERGRGRSPVASVARRGPGARP